MTVTQLCLKLANAVSVEMVVFNGFQWIVDAEIIWPDCAFLAAINCRIDVKSAYRPIDLQFSSEEPIGRLDCSTTK